MTEKPKDIKAVLVSGASRGLGLEFVRQYGEAGWQVFAGCRQPAEAEALQGLAVETGGRVKVCRLDVTQVETIRETVGRIEAEAGRLDVLVNNAGVGADGEGGLMKTREEQMLYVFHVNAVGPVSVTRECVDLLRRGEAPRVIHLVSGAGLLGAVDREPGKQYSYGGTKAALHHFVRRMAFDLEAEGIIVVGIGPGFVLTDMTRSNPRTPPLRPPESVRGMITTTDRLTMADTGRFFGYDGRDTMWVPKGKES